MLHVDVFQLRGEDQVKVGTISLQGDRLVADPVDDPILLDLAREPLMDAGKLLLPWREPGDFLMALCRHYSGTTTRVSAARSV